MRDEYPHGRWWARFALVAIALLVATFFVLDWYVARQPTGVTSSIEFDVNEYAAKECVKRGGTPILNERYGSQQLYVSQCTNVPIDYAR